MAEPNVPEINLSGLPKELTKAFKLISRLIELNKLPITYSLTMDFELDSYGVYDYSKRSEIRVNPYLFKNATNEEIHALYYTVDFSLLAVAVHEFNHLLDDRLNLLESYKEEFPEPFPLNKNAKKDRREELAELMSLYELNPYFLKLINPEVYKFLLGAYKSPTITSEKNFLAKYKRWPKEIKADCKERWGVYSWGDRMIYPS